MAQIPTVNLRAAISNPEYARLRSIGFERGVRVSDLVAAALRGCYPLSPDAEPSIRPATTEPSA